MTAVLHRELGLTDEEAESIERILGRVPNHLELAMYAVMWSEHCSYKSSRVHLRRLPTEGPAVLVGPGENAGVIDAGDGIAVAIRIESHNHPSAIEPYQGAATGVGGIIRDIFTMGARPIALMDPLRFGPPSDARNRWVASGVVSGISGYGNAVGVPTVGGELEFASCYAGNPLVNVLCCGLLPKDRLVFGRAAGEGNLAVLLGSTTGRDGIGGVSVLASAAFSDDADAEAAKRPNVQVGDPFEEKRLIEATLELLDKHLVLGIQDLGGAGLTCATSETASRGGVGMDVNVEAVPLREPGLAPFEVMTSESQERMLAIVTPEALVRCSRSASDGKCAPRSWAKVTGTGRLRVLKGWDGEVLADVPAASLHEDAPIYHRPMQRPARPKPAPAPLRADVGATELPAPASREELTRDLLSLLADPSWAFGQYDHQLFRNTVVAPGADAALLRLSAPGVRAPAGASLPRDRAVDRRQPPLVRSRPPRWHPAGRRGVSPKRRLRRSQTGGTGQLPELRQPRAPGGHVAVLGGHRRHGRGVPGARDPGRGRQRQLLQRKPGHRHRPDPGGGHARAGRPAGAGHPDPAICRWQHGRAVGPVGRSRWPDLDGRRNAGGRARPEGRCRPSTWNCMAACCNWWPRS